MSNNNNNNNRKSGNFFSDMMSNITKHTRKLSSDFKTSHKSNSSGDFTRKHKSNPSYDFKNKSRDILNESTNNYLKETIISMIKCTENYKMLLLDETTKSIISTVMTKTDLPLNNVLDFNLIEIDSSDKDKSKYLWLDCIIFVDPSISFLHVKEIVSNKRYGKYYLYFISKISDEQIEELGKCDEKDKIVDINEIYLNFNIVQDNLSVFKMPEATRDMPEATRDMPEATRDMPEATRDMLSSNLKSIADSLIIFMSSFRFNPIIRYSNKSNVCKSIGEEILKSDEFGFRDSALLLILERKDDPVTPLINWWTYQAMIHEFIGINMNKIKIVNEKRSEELLLDPVIDKFYEENMFLMFSDLSDKFSVLIDEYKKKQEEYKNITVEHIKKFTSEYPNYLKMQNTVSCHNKIIKEFTKNFSKKIMEISIVQQEIISGNDHNEIVNKMLQIINDPIVDILDKFKLVILYALKHESKNDSELEDFKLLLKDNLEDKYMKILDNILNICGKDKRIGNVFQGKSIMEYISGTSNNAYVQFKPLIHNILSEVLSNKLSEIKYPFINKNNYTNIVIYMHGGITYQEMNVINEFNKKSDIKVSVLTSQIHNSKSFLESYNI